MPTASRSGAPVEIGQRHRNLQLDALRGIAILMVLFCHTIFFRRAGWEFLLVRSGWAGVDLFFVLSGFLISGLLFSEYKRTRGIRFRRFALRRALKIYPAFYVLVFLTVGLRLANHRHDPKPILQALVHDVFFIQSYAPGTYNHFWSLSVEEHFYILLPLALYFMLRRHRSQNGDPFRFLPWLFLVVAVLALSLRLWTATHIPFSPETHLDPTHLRLDSLLFGVLLSYWSSFHGERFWAFTRSRYPWLFVGAALLLLPLLFIEQRQPWMYTYGFTSTYLGFGLLMMASLSAPIDRLPAKARSLIGILAYVGTFSYSIYLWHLAWLYTMLRLNIANIPYIGVLTFFGGSIAVGIVTSKLIEMPVLRLRDHLFPSAASRPVERQGSAVVAL